MTSTSDSPFFPNPSGQGADARAFFDAVMATIEPDLMSENTPFLETRYVGETPNEHAARMARYEAALQTFDALMVRLKTETQMYAEASKSAVILPA